MYVVIHTKLQPIKLCPHEMLRIKLFVATCSEDKYSGLFVIYVYGNYALRMNYANNYEESED